MADLDDILVVEEVAAVDVTAMSGVVQVQLALMVTAGAVGVGANVYVVWAAFRARTANLANLYVVQRAIADLTFLLAVPVMAGRIIMRTWSFGSAVCKLTVASDHMCIFASSTFLAALSVDCYRHFSHTAAPAARIRSFYIAAVVIWVGALSLSTPLFAYIDVIESRVGIAFCTVTDFNLKFVTFIDSLVLVVMAAPMVVSWACVVRMFPVYSAWKRMDMSEKALINRRFLLALSVAYTALHLPFCATRLMIIINSSFNMAMLRALQLTTPLTYINAAVTPVIFITMQRRLATAGEGENLGGEHIDCTNIPPDA